MRRRTLLAVAVGGGVGACARYGLGIAFTQETPPGFPSLTLAINLVGSFLLGALLTLVLDVWPPTRYVRSFAAIGLLGGFTTFSALVVDVDRLIGSGQAALALSYVTASLLGGIACCAVGAGAAAAWARRRAGAR